MKVSEFVKTYNEVTKDELKTAQVKQHIKRTYAPVVEKVAVLRSLLDKCELKDKNGIVFLDMVMNKISFIYAITVLYTDFEIDTSPDGKIDSLRNYDLLQENGIIDIICSKVGEREINELTFINKEVLDTWYNEHSSTRAYLATLTDKAVRTFVEISELLGRTADLNPQTVMDFLGITDENVVAHDVTEQPKE